MQYYKKELQTVLKSTNLDFMKNKTVLITGASGLIGSYLIDLLMLANEKGYNIKVIGIVRNLDRGLKRFLHYNEDSSFILLSQDVGIPFEFRYSVDFIIHAASNATPHLFNKDPIGTIRTNVEGTLNLLEISKHNNAKFIYLSSTEVYGEPCDGIEVFTEDDMGVVNPILARSCYTESKRMAENICVNFHKQFFVHTNIARIGYAYGPTFNSLDNRVIPQFINEALKRKRIVMKSAGSLMRSYVYVADVATGILTILRDGVASQAYNIANEKSNVTIREIAESIAFYSNSEIVYDLPQDEVEKGYAPFSSGLISESKLRGLGWSPKFDLNLGIQSLINILMETKF